MNLLGQIGSTLTLAAFNIVIIFSAYKFINSYNKKSTFPYVAQLFDERQDLSLGRIHRFTFQSNFKLSGIDRKTPLGREVGRSDIELVS